VVRHGDHTGSELDVLGHLGGVRDEQHRVADRFDTAGVVLPEPGFIEAHAVEQLHELDVPLQGVGRVLPDRHVVRRQEDAKAHSRHGQPSLLGLDQRQC
jgi:hypothetical protein